MSAVQPQAITVIPAGTTSNATSWVLTASGVFVDTQTVTIAGVVFTTVTALTPLAGEVVLGANQAATLTNLTAAINAPTVTTATFSALSAADANTIAVTKGLTATTTATAMTITSSNKQPVTVSETETNAAWTSIYTSRGFATNVIGRPSIQFVSSSITSGNAVFIVEVSNDSTTWTPYNRLTTNVTNTNGQTDTRVASVTLSTNTSSVVSIPDAFAFYRVVATITTDGTYSATAYTI